MLRYVIILQHQPQTMNITHSKFKKKFHFAFGQMLDNVSMDTKKIALRNKFCAYFQLLHHYQTRYLEFLYSNSMGNHGYCLWIVKNYQVLQSSNINILCTNQTSNFNIGTPLDLHNFYGLCHWSNWNIVCSLKDRWSKTTKIVFKLNSITYMAL